MKKIVCGIIVLLCLIPALSYSTDWQTFYDECANGVSGDFFIFNKQCKWQKMSCNDYANWKYNWKAWKTGSNFPSWAIKDHGHCPDGSYIESTWPRIVYKGTGKGTKMNDPDNTVSRTPPPKPSSHAVHRTTEEQYQRNLDNAKYRASINMGNYIDDSLFFYTEWARNSGNPTAYSQGLKVDMNYNQYSDCIRDVLSGVLTEYKGTKAGNLSQSEYRNFVDTNFVVALQDCSDMINNPQ